MHSRSWKNESQIRNGEKNQFGTVHIRVYYILSATTPIKMHQILMQIDCIDSKMIKYSFEKVEFHIFAKN